MAALSGARAAVVGGLSNYTDHIVPRPRCEFELWLYVCVRRRPVERKFPDIKARRFEIRRHFPEVPVRKEEMNRRCGW